MCLFDLGLLDRGNLLLGLRAGCILKGLCRVREDFGNPLRRKTKSLPCVVYDLGRDWGFLLGLFCSEICFSGVWWGQCI